MQKIRILEWEGKGSWRKQKVYPPIIRGSKRRILEE